MDFQFLVAKPIIFFPNLLLSMFPNITIFLTTIHIAKQSQCVLQL